MSGSKTIKYPQMKTALSLHRSPHPFRFFSFFPPHAFPSTFPLSSSAFSVHPFPSPPPLTLPFSTASNVTDYSVNSKDCPFVRFSLCSFFPFLPSPSPWVPTHFLFFTISFMRFNPELIHSSMSKIQCSVEEKLKISLHSALSLSLSLSLFILVISIRPFDTILIFTKTSNFIFSFF